MPGWAQLAANAAFAVVPAAKKSAVYPVFTVAVSAILVAVMPEVQVQPGQLQRTRNDDFATQTGNPIGEPRARFGNLDWEPNV